ncbi:MAG: RHS repeat protein, partial [Lentisphaeria bacterium]|nr:RHS repeat protein [Lentisphaeria bacterium]
MTSVTSAGTSGTFRVDWYSPNAVLSSGTTGYVTSAGANPVKSFQFGGVYQPALNGRDLRFYLTESRYGGTQTYYTGWEYSEEYDSDSEEMYYQGWAMYKGSASNAIQQTDLRIITSGEYSSSNFHVSNVIVSGSCSLADYVSSGGTAFYERNAEVNCGGLGNSREDEYIGSDSERTESSARISSGYGIGKPSSTEDRYRNGTYYEYDSLSRLKTVETNDGYDWLYTSYTYPQTPASGFPDYRPASVVSSYNYIDPDYPEPEYYFKQTAYSYQDDVSVGRSETIIQSANGSALTTERVWYPVAGAVVSGGTRTTALNYSDGRLKTVRNEDGTMTSYSYGAVAVSGMPSSGTIFTESATEGYCSNGAFATLPGKSVRRVNSYNVCGDLVGQERFVCLSNGAFVSIGSDSFQYNLTHQRTSAVFANGQTSSASWNCTGPTSEVSVDGVTTTYQYDGLKRCIGKVTSSPNGTITESYTLDYAGNIVQTTVTGSNGLSLSSSAVYDQEGRVISSVDPAGQTTSWEYSYDRRTTSETHADGGEVVTEITPEGMLDTISGTAATRKHSWYYTSDYVLQVREEYEGTGDHWQCTCTDGHGHVVLTEAPSFDYDTIVSASQFYDSLGRHVSTFVSGQPGLSKTYDAMG